MALTKLSVYDWIVNSKHKHNFKFYRGIKDAHKMKQYLMEKCVAKNEYWV